MIKILPRAGMRLETTSPQN